MYHVSYQTEPNSMTTIPPLRTLTLALLKAREYAVQGKEWAIKRDGLWFIMSKGFQAREFDSPYRCYTRDAHGEVIK